MIKLTKMIFFGYFLIQLLTGQGSSLLALEPRVSEIHSNSSPMGKSLLISANDTLYYYFKGDIYSYQSDLQRTTQAPGITGRDINEPGRFLSEITATLNRIEQGGINGARLIHDIVRNSDKSVVIVMFNESHRETRFINTRPKQGSLYWMPNFSIDSGGDQYGEPLVLDGTIALAHELGHVWDWMYGEFDMGVFFKFGGLTFPNCEMTAMRFENIIRAELGYKARRYFFIDRSKNMSTPLGKLPPSYRVNGFERE